MHRSPLPHKPSPTACQQVNNAQIWVKRWCIPDRGKKRTTHTQSYDLTGGQVLSRPLLPSTTPQRNCSLFSILSSAQLLPSASSRALTGEGRRDAHRPSVQYGDVLSCFSSICLHLLPLPPCSPHRAPVLRSGAQRKQGVNPNKIDLMKIGLLMRPLLKCYVESTRVIQVKSNIYQNKV